jgi:hypothetical protein
MRLMQSALDKLNALARTYTCKPEDKRINDVNNADAPYVLRWVIADTPWFKLYIHKIARSEDLGIYHDHPWPFMSIMLENGYTEEIKKPSGACERTVYKPGDVIFHKPGTPHRLELINDKPCWTLFMCGPQVRKWKFHDGC